MAGSANIAVDLDLTGDKALMRKLDRLAAKAGRNVLMKAMRAGSRPIARAAKARAPVRRLSGPNLKKSIGRRFKWYNTSGTYVVVVGPRIKYAKEKSPLTGKKELKRDAAGKRISELAGQHGYIVEYGTGPRYTKSGAFRGIGPAQPFMRPAWDSTKKLAEQLAIAKLREEVWREARRGG